MRKRLFMAAVLCLATAWAWAEQVVIETRNVSMVLDVEQGKQPKYVYFGAKLNTTELAHLQAPT